jgi:hypothetical protein
LHYILSWASERAVAPFAGPPVLIVPQYLIEGTYCPSSYSEGRGKSRDLRCQSRDQGLQHWTVDTISGEATDRAASPFLLTVRRRVRPNILTRDMAARAVHFSYSELTGVDKAMISSGLGTIDCSTPRPSTGDPPGSCEEAYQTRGDAG